MNLDRRELRCGDDSIELRRKVFDVLRLLVEAAPSAIAKQDLLDQAWPDVVTSEESLTQTISQARRALADVLPGTEIIHTVRGFGYVMAVPVETVDRASLPPTSDSPVAGPRTRRARRILRATAAVLVFIALGIWASWPRPIGLLIDMAGVGAPLIDPPLPEEPSLVILAFDNMSGDPDQEYLADGITEELTTELSRNRDLFVIARNSAFAYKDRAVTVGEIGRELGVRYVVEGSLRRDSDRVRVTAQLINATDGFHIWGEQYDSEWTNLFAVQSEIAEQIMGAVGIEIRAAEIERIRRKPEESATAHDLYMRAFHRYIKFTRDDHEAAREILQTIIAMEPRYAAAQALLGGIHLNQYYNLWSLDDRHLDRVIELSDRALAIDETNPTALVNKSTALAARRDLAQARAYAERAVAASPNWDVPYTVLAVSQVASGDAIGALRSVRSAMRRNPKVSGGDLMALGDINFLAGRTDVAQDIYEEIRAANPDLIPARLQLAVLYESAGQHASAAQLIRECLEVNPELTADRLAETALTAMFFDPDRKDEVKRLLRQAGLP